MITHQGLELTQLKGACHRKHHDVQEHPEALVRTHPAQLFTMHYLSACNDSAYSTPGTTAHLTQLAVVHGSWACLVNAAVTFVPWLFNVAGATARCVDT